MSADHPKSVFNELPAETEQHMDKQRAYVARMVAEHFPSQGISGNRKDFALLQKVLDAELVAKDEQWELQALGVVFGDALIDFIDGLAWWEVTDEYGTDPTLRYRDKNLQLNALTMLSKRVEDGEETDVAHIANWLKNFIETKSQEYQ